MDKFKSDWFEESHSGRSGQWNWKTGDFIHPKRLEDGFLTGFKPVQIVLWQQENDMELD